MRNIRKLNSISLIKNGSDHFFYIGATIISAFVHFLYSVYVKTRIEPLEYGIYSTCLLLQTYLTYAQLGSLNAFNRDYPQIIGANDHEKARTCRNSIFTFLLIIFSASAIIVVAAMYFAHTIFHMDFRYSMGMVLCSILTLVTIIENFLCSRVRIEGGFKYTSFTIIAELISVGIGVYLIPEIGYYSLYAASISAMLIGIILYYKRGLSDIELRIDTSLLGVMIISGMPLLINNLIWTVVNSIDKFIILGFISTEALGIYSIAQMAFSYVVLIPNAMSQLFYVNLGKVYGATKSKQLLIDTGIKYTSVLAVVLSFIVLVAYYFIQPVVDWIMPRYSSGVSSAQILMVALAIYAPTTVNSNILTILKQNAALLRSSIYLLILNLFCSIAFVFLRGANIESVALGTAVSYCARTIILIIQLRRHAGVPVVGMISASIIPVLGIVGPGVIFYYLIGNHIVGLAIAFLIAIFFSIFIIRRLISS